MMQAEVFERSLSAERFVLMRGPTTSFDRPMAFSKTRWRRGIQFFRTMQRLIPLSALASWREGASPTAPESDSRPGVPG